MSKNSDAVDATVTINRERTDLDNNDVVLEVRTKNETNYVAVSPAAARQLENELASLL